MFPSWSVALSRNASSYISGPSFATWTLSPACWHSVDRALCTRQDQRMSGSAVTEMYQTHSMHLAVADGPNHSPGCFPHAEAPCSTNRWIEKGARGSSAKSDSRRVSSSSLVPRRHSIPEQGTLVGKQILLCSVSWNTSSQSQDRQRVGKQALPRSYHAAPSCVRCESFGTPKRHTQPRAQSLRCVVTISSARPRDRREV